jgi:hypothetical protein
VNEEIVTLEVRWRTARTGRRYGLAYLPNGVRLSIYEDELRLHKPGHGIEISPPERRTKGYEPAKAGDSVYVRFVPLGDDPVSA